MEHPGPLDDIARFLRRLQWTALAVAVCWLLWLLAPILTPFVLAALLAWLGDPLVDKLQRAGRSRNVAVALVFTAMALLVVLALVLLVPTIEDQIHTLVRSMPKYQAWFMQTALPWVEDRSGLELTRWLDLGSLVELVRGNWERAGGVATTLLGYMSRSGFALLGLVANVALLPVITFFFLRGQFLVMLILGVMYGAGLWGVGLDLGILIGIIAGLLTFVPYLGPASGILLGCIAALVQFGDWQHVAGVLVVFGIGQVIESYWLTPKLVGDRIGLHPVAVIFAVLAGGQLFGFLGMLLALPVAAIVNVLLRYAQERYTHSRLYAGDHPAIVMDGVRKDGHPHPPEAE